MKKQRSQCLTWPSWDSGKRHLARPLLLRGFQVLLWDIVEANYYMKSPFTLHMRIRKNPPPTVLVFGLDHRLERPQVDIPYSIRASPDSGSWNKPRMESYHN